MLPQDGRAEQRARLRGALKPNVSGHAPTTGGLLAVERGLAWSIKRSVAVLVFLAHARKRARCSAYCGARQPSLLGFSLQPRLRVTVERQRG
jgi:hypothetical protein